MNTNKFFTLARNVRDMSDFPRQKLGAVLVYKNNVIATGFNTRKESPIQKHYNRYRGYNPDATNNGVHAEMQCLIKTKNLDINWRKVSIFVYRETKDGNKALAKPCPACMRAMKERGIKNIYYTGHNSYIHERID